MITKRERGSATIEATISLTMFVFVIMAIYTLINFCMVQAKVAYAIDTTAKEMSQYSYFYHALGADTLDEKLAENKTQAVDTFTNFSNLLDNADSHVSEASASPTDYFGGVLSGGKTDDFTLLAGQIKKSSENISDVINDPGEFVKSLASIAGEKIWNRVKTNVIAAPIAKGMTRRHFGSSSIEANKYLESLGVVGGYDGINFNYSTLFEDGSKDINIVVCYNLDLATQLPFDLKVTIFQRATTRAWLGGDASATTTTEETEGGTP